MSERVRSGAKAATWNWNDLQSTYSDDEHCYKLTNRQVAALLTVVSEQMQWSTRWFDYDNFDEIDAFVGELAYRLMVELLCVSDPTPCPNCGKGHGGMKIGDTIFAEDCMGNIIIYNCGCGCGSGGHAAGGGGSFGGGSSAGGGGAGGSWTSSPEIVSSTPVQGISQCEIASSLIPYVMQQFKEFALFLDNNSENLNAIVDGLVNGAASIVPILGNFTAQAVDWTTSMLDFGTTALVTLSSDIDFQLKVQEAWIAIHGEDGRVQSVTRQDFLSIVGSLPRIWLSNGGILDVRTIIDGFFRVMDMGKVSARLALSKGNGDAALCEWLYAQAGMVQPDIVDSGSVELPDLQIGVSNGFAVYRAGFVDFPNTITDTFNLPDVYAILTDSVIETIPQVNFYELTFTPDGQPQEVIASQFGNQVTAWGDQTAWEAIVDLVQPSLAVNPQFRSVPMLWEYYSITPASSGTVALYYAIPAP